MRASKMLLSLSLVVFVCSGQDCVPDSDGDGIGDPFDSCANTPICATVDAMGCPSDSDGDGVFDGCDDCAETILGAMVWSNGCEADPSAVPARCFGPDLRAKEIEYSLVNRTGPSSGTILIKGIVDNVGQDDFESVAGSQSIELWADGSPVATTAFTDVVVDAIVTVEYELSWDTQSELVAVQTYKLIVSYDPDIYDDGIETNDDCRSSNNMLIRGTSGIATLLE